MNIRTELVKKMDGLWRLIIAHQFSHYCIACGKPGTDSHHWAYRRSILKYRWHLFNGVYLCRPCHDSVKYDNGRKLDDIIIRWYPYLFQWYKSQPQLTVEHIAYNDLLLQYAKLMQVAIDLGLKGIANEKSNSK